MADALVLTDIRADGVATLRLNRPPMNALSQALLTELGAAARALGDHERVKAVVVLGGEKAFAAGADISEFSDQAAAKRIGKTFRHAFDAVAAIARPVIAAVNGFALGGGMELACACDLRVAGDRAKLGQPEILLGIIPGAGGTQRLTRLVGPARAKDLVWSGRQVGSDEALAMGLVDRVVPAGECEEHALDWAAELASGAVAAMGLAKGAIDGGLDGSLARGLDLEAEAFVEVFGTEDAKTGVASFLEHGPGRATFSGR
ncbi:MAG: enoyl-CoA hydratase/isomerase family protein [Actinobacteria bacterium]|nr:enoyl-CoA hydratase/isomerase family protein [Actinomycetota bacterium]